MTERTHSPTKKTCTSRHMSAEEMDLESKKCSCKVYIKKENCHNPPSKLPASEESTNDSTPPNKFGCIAYNPAVRKFSVHSSECHKKVTIEIIMNNEPCCEKLCSKVTCEDLTRREEESACTKENKKVTYEKETQTEEQSSRKKYKKKTYERGCQTEEPSNRLESANKPTCDESSAENSWFDSQELQSLQKSFLNEINLRRQWLSLPQLTLNPMLNECAAKHNYDQAFNMNGIHHKGSDGSDLSDRLKRVGYPFAWAGENLAHRQKTVVWAVNSLMKSPGHRKNIVSERATEMGIHGGIGKDGYWYWTQILGARKVRRRH